jgi:hypothetical protein
VFVESVPVVINQFKNEEFTSKVVKSAEEACKLVEAGFEYICTTARASALRF